MRYKVIEILKTFSEKELKEFNTFLASPFFNESRKLKCLFTELIEFYPGFDPEEMSEEKLSRKISPELEYNKSTMKTLFFELANSAEEFLKISNFRSKQLKTEDYLREEYFKRKLYKYVEQNSEKTIMQLDAEKDYSLDYYLDRFKVITDKCNLIKANKLHYNQDYINSFMKFLNERAKILTHLITSELLIQNNMVHTLKKNYEISDDDNFIYKLFNKIDIEELLKFIIKESDDSVGSVIFELQLANYRALSDFDNEDHYHKFKKLLVGNIHKLSKDEVYSYIIMLIKYCHYKPVQNKSGFDFKKELFSIYKFILSKKLYEIGVHNYFPIELYRLVLKLGLEMGKFSWTLNFIRKYNPMLNSDVRKNMYNYSLAEYYFHKKRFDKAMRYFHKIELNHFVLRVDIKNLMLMTYYELDLFENALSLIDSYKHFLSNTIVLSDIEKNKCRNFITVVQNMIRYRTSVKPVSKNILLKNLEADMHNKVWVNERFQLLDDRFTRSA